MCRCLRCRYYGQVDSSAVPAVHEDGKEVVFGGVWYKVLSYRPAEDGVVCDLKTRDGKITSRVVPSRLVSNIRGIT